MTLKADPTAILDAPPADPGADPGIDSAPPVAPEAIPPVPPAPPPDPMVEGIPLPKYLEIKHRERAAQDQIRQYQEQLRAYQQPRQEQEIPDPLVDPQGYAYYVASLARGGEGATQTAITEQKYAMSEMIARTAHGDDRVEEAITAFEALPESMEKRLAWQAFNSTRHPWDALIRWHDQKRLLDQISEAGDPDAYVRKRYAELQAQELQGQATGAAPAPAAPRPPAPGTPFRGGPRRAPAPSLSNAPPSAVRTAPTLMGPGATFEGQRIR